MNDKKTKEMLYKIIKEGKNDSPFPIFIDFYVDYKQSCFNFVQVVDSTKSKYEGKIVFVSVDVEKEPELASLFNVVDTPRMILIPQDGTPEIKNASLNSETLEYYLDGMILDKLYTEVEIDDEVINNIPEDKKYPPAELLQHTVETTVTEKKPPNIPVPPKDSKPEPKRPERPKRPSGEKSKPKRPVSPKSRRQSKKPTRPKRAEQPPKKDEVKPKEKNPGFFERFKK
jgi:hypothetical protein